MISSHILTPKSRFHDLGTSSIAGARVYIQRLVPARYPQVPAFEKVATAADLEVVMAVEGWTNDATVKARVARLPTVNWAFGRAHADVLMASFFFV